MNSGSRSPSPGPKETKKLLKLFPNSQQIIIGQTKKTIASESARVVYPISRDLAAATHKI